MLVLSLFDMLKFLCLVMLLLLLFFFVCGVFCVCWCFGVVFWCVVCCVGVVWVCVDVVMVVEDVIEFIVGVLLCCEVMCGVDIM